MAKENCSDRSLDGKIEKGYSCLKLSCSGSVIHSLVLFGGRTPPEYQPRIHVRIVYAVGAASDIATRSVIVVDGRLDQCDTRGGSPYRHTRHSLTLPTDISVLTTVGKRTLRFLVPDIHPYKRDLRDLHHNYQDYCLDYLSVAGARLPSTPEELRPKPIRHSRRCSRDTASLLCVTPAGGLHVTRISLLQKTVGSFTWMFIARGNAKCMFWMTSETPGPLTTAGRRRPMVMVSRRRLNRCH